MAGGVAGTQGDAPGSVGGWLRFRIGTNEVGGLVKMGERLGPERGCSTDAAGALGAALCWRACLSRVVAMDANGAEPCNSRRELAGLEGWQQPVRVALGGLALCRLDQPGDRDGHDGHCLRIPTPRICGTQRSYPLARAHTACLQVSDAEASG